MLFAARTGGRLFAADVWRVMRRLATRAGLPADLASRLGPRVIRHSFAALCLDTGGSLRDLQSAVATPTRAPPGDTTGPRSGFTARPRLSSSPHAKPGSRFRTVAWRPASLPRPEAQRAAGHTRPRLSRPGTDTMRSSISPVLLELTVLSGLIGSLTHPGNIFLSLRDCSATLGFSQRHATSSVSAPSATLTRPRRDDAATPGAGRQTHRTRGVGGTAFA